MHFTRSYDTLQLELLTGLDRSSTALTGLARLTSLRVLKLNWNTPIAFPAALLQLHSLSVLTIGAVDHLPRDVHCLDSLTRFEMLSCVQRRTPEHLSTLRSLCQLVCIFVCGGALCTTPHQFLMTQVMSHNVVVWSTVDSSPRPGSVCSEGGSTTGAVRQSEQSDTAHVPVGG